jgi:hypothetical protein
MRRMIPIVMLLASALACDLAGGPPPDAEATLDAAVMQTVSAQQTLGATPRPTASPLPPTPTQPPPIGVTLQFPTDTPLPNVNPTDTGVPSTAPTATLTPGLVSNAVRPNGTPVHARPLGAPPAVDCSLSEWGTLPNPVDQNVFRPQNWSGAADQSATYALGWDANNLYVAAHVVDDRHVQIEQGELIFRGDSLELLLDADLSGDYNDASLGADDYQLGLSPGANKTPNPAAFLWFPSSKKGAPAAVNVIGCTDGGEGYLLEAAIPWSTFGVTPNAGKSFGFALSSSDNDTPATADQQSMISSVNTRRLTDPTTWGTLVLDP